MLLSLLRYAPFHDSHQKPLAFRHTNQTLANFIKPRSILKQLCMWLVEIVIVDCVTEQTHDIRVYGLCDDARFAVPHNFAQINHEQKHTARVHRPYILFAPCIMSTSRRAFFHAIVKLCL